MRVLGILRLVLLAAYLLVGLLPLGAGAESPHTPKITITPPYGPAGTVVYATGTGYTKARGETLALSLGGTVYDTAVIQRDGTVVFDPVTIPSGPLQLRDLTDHRDLTISVGGHTIVALFTVYS